MCHCVRAEDQKSQVLLESGVNLLFGVAPICPPRDGSWKMQGCGRCLVAALSFRKLRRAKLQGWLLDDGASLLFSSTISKKGSDVL